MLSGRGYCDLGFAKIDTDRQKRKGFSEVIYCPGKDKAHLKGICALLVKKRQNLLLTKLGRDSFIYLKRYFPKLKYSQTAQLGYLISKAAPLKKEPILVMSAGTSDLKIAEEAAVTCEVMGNKVRRLLDVGVAGVHRLMHNIELIRKAKVIVVVAGMEGALASLVSGLVSVPVIAVPTSCGYGANFGGLSALLSMLNTCSPGVVVVNIDNGFGAGYFASLINS